jgi:N-acyl-D-amino-acid deacylase
MLRRRSPFIAFTRALCALTCALILVGCGARAPRGGPSAPFADLNQRVQRVLDDYGVRGASVAITYQGRLVHERGFGHPRGDDGVATTPQTRFRIASLTKPMTSVAVHLLHQRGQLDLDARVVPLLLLEPPDPALYDPRWDTITVRHLLVHAGGFDREESFDPMFANATYAKMFERQPEPDSLDAIIAVMLQRPLDFDPGTDQAYSNFGYSLLGRVIERVSGSTYEAFIRDELLAPMGVTGIALGHELPERRPADEAFYFPDPTEELLPNLLSADRELVSPADGGFFLEPMAAHGGFIASATDYARFLVHVDGLPQPPDRLRQDELSAMLSRPLLPSAASSDEYYADGWNVIPMGDDAIWSHTGAKPGTTSLAVRLPSGVCYVALANGRPLDGDFVVDLDLAILDGLEQVAAFPAGDLFERRGGGF